MHIEYPGPMIGALVTGVDLKCLSDREWRELYRVWQERSVLVVRGQDLQIEDYLAYSRRFGTLKPHRVRRTRHPDYPELTMMGMGARAADGKVNELIYNRGLEWHTDGPWDTEVCIATQLYGVEIPSRGGDTLFASMFAAYDSLPAGLKHRIEGLQGEFAYGGRPRTGIERLEPEDRMLPPAVHPVVQVHRHSGRKALYVNPGHLLGFVGMGELESTELMEELFSHMLQPGAEYRHTWRVGDAVIWDNRYSIHAAGGGYPPNEPRIHWRVTIMEDPALESTYA